jgi:hypothetical protein
MALPKQVEQQMREVEEMERQLQPVAETETGEQPTDAGTEAIAEAAPQAEASNVVELKKPEEDWQQKYRTLDGKYNAEVPRLHHQVKELSNQVQALITQLEDAKKPAAREETHEALVTANDEEAFGKDLIDVQRRVAKEVMREYVTPLQKELQARDAKIAQLEQQMTKTGGEVTTMSFEQQLARAVPDFDAINTDPKWIAWLDEVDPFTRKPRRSYAEYVYNQGDVAEVSQLVKFYKESTGVDQQTAAQHQRQTELNRQVQPTRTASSSSVAPAGARVYTEAEMSRLWDKVRQMNVAGKYEEAKKLDTELSDALIHGRIRG